MQKIFIAGCIGADAKVSDPHKGRIAINFTVAVNTKKGDTEVATWYNCAYWRDEDKAKVAQHLKKGTGVIIEGTPDVDVWKDSKNGEPRGTIKVVVQSLEFMSGTKKEGSTSDSSSEETAASA